jgi:hypothetical protein
MPAVLWQSYYRIAVAGCAYINASNLRKAFLTWKSSRPQHLHAN